MYLRNYQEISEITEKHFNGQLPIEMYLEILQVINLEFMTSFCVYEFHQELWN